MSSTADSGSKKVILVIGATGGQGLAVIEKLLAPCEDGSPSPYAVRALTRDPENYRAKKLISWGVECVKGRFDDFACVASALKGAYGAYVNTDGFSVGEEREQFAGVRIFELAKQAGLRHFVWSNLDYVFKLGGYDPKYKCEHYDGKGRVAEFMKAQPSTVSDNDMSWSVITSGPYMDMLFFPMFGPLKQREDGTVVFATPVGKGNVAMTALADMGFFARYCFDNRALTSGVELPVASDVVNWDQLCATFEKVTGFKTELIHQSIPEWFENLESAGDGSTLWRENFTSFWQFLKDDLVKRDMEWLLKINPNTLTLEKWMRAERYGENLWSRMNLLKNVEEGKNISPNWGRINQY